MLWQQLAMTLTNADEALEWAEKIKEKQEGVEFWIVTNLSK